jgi:hypothetical protein
MSMPLAIGKLSSGASIGIPVNLSLMQRGHLHHYFIYIYMTTTDIHTL